MKTTSYKTLSAITTGLCSTLAVFLLLIPEPIFYLFGVSGDVSAYFISRRAAMFFVGYAVIAFLTRNEQPSASRQAISMGIGISMLGFFVLGLFEFLRGFAGAGILLPMTVELFLTVSYCRIWLGDKKEEV